MNSLSSCIQVRTLWWNFFHMTLFSNQNLISNNLFSFFFFSVTKFLICSIFFIKLRINPQKKKICIGWCSKLSFTPFLTRCTMLWQSKRKETNVCVCERERERERERDAPKATAVCSIRLSISLCRMTFLIIVATSICLHHILVLNIIVEVLMIVKPIQRLSP